MKKILVIEDEGVLLENIEDILSFEEFEVITAENGLVGVQKALATRPDLIICDIMMPVLDGYGVLSKLKAHASTAMIPLIFLTAKADRLDLRKGMELGADDYLTKPFTPDELLRAIAIRLEKKTALEKHYEQELNQLRNSIRIALPHEMRTPLTGIMTSTDFLLSELEELDPLIMREMLQLMKNAGTRLNGLIQNFLFYTDLELALNNEERVKELRSRQISSVVEVMQKIAQEKAREYNREADLELGPMEDAAVRMGKDSLLKLVEELVDNAFKFSQEGTPIRISSSLKKKSFIFCLSDRGRGMTSAQINEIGAYRQFERQLHEQQGAGLGLAIVRLLTKIHQGELIIESIPQRETTITVLLPI